MGNKHSNIVECPHPETLAKFLVGNLADPLVCDEIGRHLETCTECVHRLTQIDANTNPLVASLQRGSHRPVRLGSYQFEENCDKVLQQVLEICNQRTTSPQNASTANISEQTVASLDRLKKKTGQLDATTIGSYQLIEQIGAGGMGVVYKAKHTKLNRLVGIKLLSKDRFENDQAKRRFEREMQAVGRLKHPNIVASYDAGEAGGYSFLAMELLNGIDLSELNSQRSSPVKVSDACELIRQAAIGLQYAHQHGIVHRDVKPSNIMLCDVQNPIVKLLDLGLARFEQPDPTQESMTSINQMMGTIDYMSPEQCLDSRDVDARSDIYSLGATLFCLLVGRAPWADENHQTQGKKLKALLSEQLDSIAILRSDLQEGLVSIVDRCLKRDPNDRFQDVGELISALKPLCHEHGLASLIGGAQKLELTANSTGASSLEIPALSAVGSKSRPEKAPNQPTSLTKWLMLGMLLVGLLLAGVIWLKLTDGGYIRIESDPSVQVTIEILKDGRKIDAVEIGKESNVYWYRAGQYEIRLPTRTEDNLEIIDGQFNLSRGGYSVARISRKTKEEKENEPVVPTRPEQISWPESIDSEINHLVTNLENDGPGSLRETIRQCNSGDTIGFSEELVGLPIKLNTQIEIGKSISISALHLIEGDVKFGITIDCQRKSRAFHVTGKTTRFVLEGIQLTQGNANLPVATDTTFAGGLISAVACDRVELSQCMLEDSNAQAGGALYVKGGTLYLENCTFAKNQSETSGGAVYLDSTFKLMDSTSKRLICWIRNCSMFENRAHKGGAIVCRKSILRITRSTFAKNETVIRAGNEKATNWNASGGAMRFTSDTHALVEHCTIVNNRAAHVGGGVSNSIFPQEILLKNSVVANNQAVSSCPDLHDAEGNSILLKGGNLIGAIDGSQGQPKKLVAGLPNPSGDYIGTNDQTIDPKLAPLGDHGGWVYTMQPLPDSPLIDAAVAIEPAVFEDARGVFGPIDGYRDGSAQPDIGAVEFDPGQDQED